MAVAVSDTGPLNCLVLIQQIEVLPRIFERVYVPNAVAQELTNPRTPSSVRAWFHNSPMWLEKIGDHDSDRFPPLSGLDGGERAAIAAAVNLRPDIVLVDDRRAAEAARRLGLATMGTLGILVLGAGRNLVDLAASFELLRKTNFYHRNGLMDRILLEHTGRNGSASRIK